MTGNTFFREKRKKKKKEEGWGEIKKKKRERAVLSFSVPGAEHVSVSIPRVGKSVNQKYLWFLWEY